MPRRITNGVFAATLVGLTLGLSPAAAQYLQVDVTRSLTADRGGRARFSVPIEGGGATISGVIRDLRGDTVSVDLLLDYPLPPGQFGFDEVIERIEVATEDAGGSVFMTAVLDTRLIPLNPNRAPLSYRVTRYRPGEGKYRVRVRLVGNYE